MRQAWALLYPLVFVSLFSRCTPVLDRYFASSLPEGNIAHLSYAFRVVTFLSMFLSGGFAPVLFPKMARSASTSDLAGLRRTLSSGLIFMWILVAPVILIGMVVSSPLITSVFVRGQFTGIDAQAVSALLRIYLIALVGTCAGSLTGRCFYALQDTRTPAVIGTIETVVYAFYAAWLTRYLGASGLVWAYVIYFNVSLLWQIIVLRHKMRGVQGMKIVVSMCKTAIAAIIAAAAAWFSLGVVTSVWTQVILGLTAGLTIYAAVLSILNRQEVNEIVRMLSQTFGRPGFSSPQSDVAELKI